MQSASGGPPNVSHPKEIPTMTTPSEFASPPARLRILVDCDGVLSDFVGLILNWVERTHGLAYRRESVDQWDCLAALGFGPEEWKRLSDSVGPLELCRKMPTLPGAAAFLVALEAQAEVKVATTPMNAAWLGQRAEWLEEHMGIPLERQIHIHDKSDLAGPTYAGKRWDLLIDDKVENCVAFAEAGGISFCLAAAYNTDCPADIERGTHADCLDFVGALTSQVE
jgi:5'(3')-deoxyribonucleotidase